MTFSVGMGLTNECDLKCPHCYRSDMVVSRLSLADVARVCESLPVRSMNLGVGENGLHPEYHAILSYFWTRGIKTSITSNGLSVRALSDGDLRRLHSVECSLDFPSETEHDRFRGAGNWRRVIETLERCVGLGVSATVTTVMMSLNHDRLGAVAKIAAGFGANLRVNIYQPSKTDRFSLTYTQFWDGLRRLLGAARLVATTEPVLAGVLGLDDFRGSACGRSTVRVAPDRGILPCTYWPATRLSIDDLAARGAAIVEAPDFADARRVPPACEGCPCRGGCAGRRALTARLDSPDPYCPFARGERITLDWERATIQDLLKLSSACTTVVSAR